MEAIDRFTGFLLGTAIGDSLLLPAEGLSRSRIARRFSGELRQRLLFGYGMVSDDTDHHFLVACCLAAYPNDPQRFARRLGWRLRWWLLCVPAGCGKATGRGIIKLLCGWPPHRSGVSSGGNGPSMRAAIIGVYHANNIDLRTAFIKTNTEITHHHPHASAAAHAVSEIAALITRNDHGDLWSLLDYNDPDWRRVLTILKNWYETTDTTDYLATALDCPDYVSGWSLHSVPFAIGCWLRHRDDAQAGMSAILRAGGDTDTIGAIAGALYGADRGEAAFPTTWLSYIVDWPISVRAIRTAGATLAGAPRKFWWWPLLPIRNVCFFIVVIAHIFRRLSP